MQSSGSGQGPYTEDFHNNLATVLALLILGIVLAFMVFSCGCAARVQPIQNHQPVREYRFHYEAPQKPAPRTGDVKQHYDSTGK